jgi:hypothetical protein
VFHEASCFSAVASVYGWNQWYYALLQFCSPFSHTFGNGISCRAIQLRSIVNNVDYFGYAFSGRYLYIFARVNTFEANYSEGRSAGAATSTAFFLKAVSTTLNLNFDITLFVDVIG